MMTRLPVYAPLVAVGLAMFLVGCQLPQHTPPSEEGPKTSGVHLQFHEQSNSSDDFDAITLISPNETLHKAIRTAYPDAPITADSGVRLDQRINVWAEGLSPARYLDYLGSQVDAEIRLTDRGEVEVRSATQWEFTLPREEAKRLMPQAVRMATQAGVTSLVLGESEHILILSGKPSDLERVRRALNRVSERITLERNMAPKEAQS